jgi:hypothetical protein
VAAFHPGMNRSAGILGVVALAAALGLGALWLSERRATEALRKELEPLRAGATRLAELEAEVTKLRGENSALAARLPQLDEVVRLRAEASELRRVRDELNRVKAAADALQKRASAAPTPPAPTPPAGLAPSPAPFTLSTTARLGRGQSVVTGGWEIAPGKRGFAFVTPDIQADGTVVLSARILSLPEAAAATVGLGNLVAPGGAAQGYSLAENANLRTVFATLQNTPGAEVLAAPQVRTQPGTDAVIQVGDPTSGTIQLRFNPRMLPDGQGLDLDLQGAITLPSGAK